jgi:arsenate reductase (glutaredoxin)
MVEVWGLKNCDTCRKALAWLKDEGFAHRFRDVRAEGLDPAALKAWIAELGWEALVNTRGTTWRGLPEAEREGLDAARAHALILAQPAVMKRPVFDLGKRRLVGFKATEQAALRASG